ncbi:MAG TPA: diacylglycerol kinase family protein [Streptosporangiaceae bacterium]
MPIEPEAVTPATRPQRWLARLSFLLAAVAAAIPPVFAGLTSIAMLGLGLGAAAVTLAAAYVFLSRRGVWRWLSLGVCVAAPIAVIVVYAFAALLWVAVASAAAWLFAGVTARSALAGDQARWRMPELPVSPASHPFLIMNPRSGGGKVGKFDLKRKAEDLGAEVFLMSGPEPVDVAAVAEGAAAAGADLLGVAGGDGTQALVAGVAARHDIPFMVITAGTRNHFALDLGLDREDPSACLGALSDGVELCVDLGMIGSRTFVNNASFGAYADVVQTPAYRDDKLGTTLNLLPDLLQGHRGAKLDARADGIEISGPQALLVANNPYGSGDIAGLSRRVRLDRGTLGVVGVQVDSPQQAVGLLRGRRARGLSLLTATKVEITANTPQVPVGIDGEAVMMPTPVLCTVRPGALRVRVPRDRPGASPREVPMDWGRLKFLAVPRLRRRASRRGLPRAPAPRSGLSGYAYGAATKVMTAYERVAERQDLLRRTAELSPKTVIVDVEPLVAFWDTSQESLDEGLAAVLRPVAAIPGVEVVCFATNSARRPTAVPAAPGIRVMYLSSARKPMRIAPYQNLPRPGIVIGDQAATDGILAHRLGYTFLLYSPRLENVPIGPHLLQRCGELVLPVLFRNPRVRGLLPVEQPAAKRRQRMAHAAPVPGGLCQARSTQCLGVLGSRRRADADHRGKLDSGPRCAECLKSRCPGPPEQPGKVADFTWPRHRQGGPDWVDEGAALGVDAEQRRAGPQRGGKDQQALAIERQIICPARPPVSFQRMVSLSQILAQGAEERRQAAGSEHASPLGHVATDRRRDG